MCIEIIETFNNDETLRTNKTAYFKSFGKKKCILYSVENVFENVFQNLLKK